jgi:hypothetical protein
MGQQAFLTQNEMMPSVAAKYKKSEILVITLQNSECNQVAGVSK